MDLTNKTVLLTGAGGGIGQALAQALAKKGAKLCLVGHNEQAMQLLRQHLPHPEQHNIAVMQTYSDDEIGALASSVNEWQAGHPD